LSSLRLSALLYALGLMTFLPAVFLPLAAVAQVETELEERDPAWLWSLRLARLAARPGGSSVLEPGLLKVTYARPLADDLWRRDLDDGETLGDGMGIRLETGYRRPLGENIVLRARIRATAHAGVPDRIRFLEGGVWGVTGPVGWSVGRQRFFWSPSTETSLLLSTNARPLDAVSLRSARPWGLPWKFGHIQWETFLAYLDDPDRTIPYPLLWGGQFYWQPFPSFRLELRRTILFGGAGRTEKLNFGDVIDILLGQDENLPADQRDVSDSDQLLSLAARWRWPLPNTARLWLHSLGFRDFEIFYEYGGEDAIRNGLPTAVAHHLGCRTQFLGWEAAGVYVETVDATNTWYEHVVYRSGYRYRGRVLGHPAGGDSRWVRIRLGRPWLSLQGYSLEGTLEKGGIFRRPHWEVTQISARWWKTPMLGLRLQVDGHIGIDQMEGGSPPPRFPRFALELSLIVGNPPEFDETFD
jgi:hypothetical protein